MKTFSLLLLFLFFPAAAHAVSYDYKALAGSSVHLNFFSPPYKSTDIVDGNWGLELDPDVGTIKISLDSDRLDFILSSNEWNPGKPGEQASNFFNPVNGSFAIPAVRGTATLDGITKNVSMSGFYLRGGARGGDILYVSGEMSFPSTPGITDIILNGKFHFNGPREAVPEPATAMMLLVPLAAAKLRKRQGSKSVPISDAHPLSS